MSSLAKELDRDNSQTWVSWRVNLGELDAVKSCSDKDSLTYVVTYSTDILVMEGRVARIPKIQTVCSACETGTTDGRKCIEEKGNVRNVHAKIQRRYVPTHLSTY